MNDDKAPAVPDRPTNEEWCREYAPTLPVRVEAIVAEWRLTDGGVKIVVDSLITAVRQSVSTQ